jgi:L-iditol 2-dehydrogenase
MECHFCRHHAFAQCTQYRRTGITAGFEPAGGGFAEYVRVMPFVLGGVVKIPAKNGFEEGAMLEPVNTVLKAVNRLNLLPDDNVLVAGQGPIGLMFTRLLQLRGINVLATDLLDSRLQLAKQFGAKWAVKPDEVGRVSPCAQSEPGRARQSLRAAQLCSMLHAPSSPLRLDAAIMAVPSDAALQQAFELVRGAGQILLFAHTKRPSSAAPEKSSSPPRSGGEGREEVAPRGQGETTTDHGPLTTDRSGLFPVDLSAICVDEKDLIGSYSADFTLQKEVARLVFSRQLDVRTLITHRFPLEKTAEAIALASHPTPDSLKVIIRMSE